MVAVLVVALLAASPQSCAPAPAPGPVIAGFDPGPGFAGHWGADYAVAPGAMVRVVLPGTVTFAGRVVDNLVVTVHHGGGMRTSYSYLRAVDVAVGDRLRAGDPVGRAGLAHDIAGFHLSLRLADRYLDPSRLWDCRTTPNAALRLVSGTGHRTLYAVRRAARHPGRNLRPSSRGPSHGRRSSATDARPRRHNVHHGR